MRCDAGRFRVQTAWASARRDPTRTMSCLARVMPVRRLRWSILHEGVVSGIATPRSSRLAQSSCSPCPPVRSPPTSRGGISTNQMTVSITSPAPPVHRLRTKSLHYGMATGGAYVTLPTGVQVSIPSSLVYGDETFGVNLTWHTPPFGPDNLNDGSGSSSGRRVTTQRDKSPPASTSLCMTSRLGDTLPRGINLRRQPGLVDDSPVVVARLL